MDHLGIRKRKLNPKTKSNILSILTFCYTLPLFKKGFTKDLNESDVYEILNDYRSKKLTDKLEDEFSKQKKKGKQSIMSLLWTCYGWTYLFFGLTKLVKTCIYVVLHPLAMGKVVAYFQPGQTELTKNDAIYYAGVLITINFTNMLYMSNYDIALAGLGIRIRTAFCSLLYRKALKLSPTQLGDISIGKIVTLITKDVHSFERFIHFANEAWIGIIQTSVITYLVYVKIGLAGAAGIGFFFLALPLQIWLGSWSAKLRMRMCATTDERLQQTQETLSAARIIKIYTWEWFFKQKIDKTRKKEMRRMHWTFYLKFLVIQTSALNSKLAFYLLIMTYTWLGNHMTAEIVYFLTSIFSILTHTMSVLFPLAISETAELTSAVKRIGNVLKAPEIEHTTQNNQITIKPKIICKEVSVNFLNVSILRNINLNLDPGVTLITGSVGSGKSFLLKTILQDYEATTGGVVTHGRMSYASQEPWLFPSSIRQNIVFGQDFDRARYERVLDVCALRFDFQLLSEGDSTIVEDRGINLSKGQQARINLARAVYRDSEIYLLDDCLSALDAHVSQFIFNECIKNFLKDKLVVFVSHNIKLIQNVDNVVLMRDGTIQTCGRPSRIELPEEELKELSEYHVVEDNKNEDEGDDESHLLAETVTEKKVYQEKKQVGKVDFIVYKKYLHFAGGFFVVLLITLFFAVNQFATSYAEKLVSKWVNLEQEVANYTIYNATNTTDGIEIIDKRNFTLNLYTVMTLSTGLLSLACSVAFFLVVKRASIQLHKYMMKHVIYATMHFFDTNFIGNILNRFSKDLNTVDEHLPFIFWHIFRILFQLIGAIVLIANVNLMFLIPTGITMAILVCMRQIYLPTSRNLKRLDASTRSPVIGHLNATLEGLTTIRAFGAETILRDEFDRHQDLYTSASYSFTTCTKAFSFFLDLLCNIFTSVVISIFVFPSNHTLAGTVGLAISQAFLMTGVLQWGIRQWAEIENCMTSVERVLEYTDVPQESTQGIDTIANWPTKGEVKYENVFLKYTNSDKHVLKNLNFTMHPKEKIGIVGRTGAGKSSIISTLFRLYEVEGKILIDGVDTRTLSLNFLRRNISIIPQDPVLFTGPIRDNIDPTGVYSDDQIWDAIATANLKQYVPSLDYEVTENGANFSVGQRQLICLARACIRSNKIIVLDEATANMDQDTDALIYDTIHRNFKECTVITIAHKLHTVLKADKIIVMDKGEISEYDSPEILIENKNGAFYKMVEKAELLPSQANNESNKFQRQFSLLA